MGLNHKDLESPLLTLIEIICINPALYSCAKGTRGGVYIHIWTTVRLGIVESENTPKGEPFQVGGHEQSWSLDLLLLTWKFPWECFLCSKLRGLDGTAVVMGVASSFLFAIFSIFFPLQTIYSRRAETI